MLAYIMGNKEEGDRMTEKAIALLETGHNEPMHAAMLVTKGMLQHKSNPAQAYLANHEAYRIAKRIGANYSLIRSLIGLVVTSQTKQEAATYLAELENSLAVSETQTSMSALHIAPQRKREERIGRRVYRSNAG